MENNYQMNNVYSNNNWQTQYQQYQRNRGMTSSIDTPEYKLLWHDKEEFYTTTKAFYIFVVLSFLFMGITYIITNTMHMLTASMFLIGTYGMYLMVIVFLFIMIFENHRCNQDKQSINNINNQIQSYRPQPQNYAYYNYYNRKR